MGSWGHINDAVGSSLNFSSGVLERISAPFKARSAANAEEEQASVDSYGVDSATKKAIDRCIIEHLKAEGPTGINEECLMCMKKRNVSWEAAEDLPQCLEELLRQEKERERAEGGKMQRKLAFRAFFSESDIMIGEGGQAYFEKCWTTNSGLAEAVDFKSVSTMGTNHDNIFLARGPAMVQALKEVSERSRH